MIRSKWIDEPLLEFEALRFFSKSDSQNDHFDFSIKLENKIMNVGIKIIKK